MEARALGFGVAAGVCGIFTFIVLYSMERDNREGERAKATVRLNELESELETSDARKQRALSKLEEAKAADPVRQMENLQMKLAAVKAEILFTEDSLGEAQKRTKTALDERAMALERNRAAAVGTTYPRLQLANGQVLQDAKLAQFTPQELTFTQGRGQVTAVRWSLLPQELIERFELSDKSDGSVILDPLAKTVRGEPMPIVDPVPAPVKDGVAEQERATREKRINFARQQLARVENELRVLSSKAAPNPNQLRILSNQRSAMQSQLSRMEQQLYE
jgi:hypothetical protein